jgi:hypothetical protein
VEISTEYMEYHVPFEDRTIQSPLRELLLIRFECSVSSPDGMSDADDIGRPVLLGLQLVIKR